MKKTTPIKALLSFLMSLVMAVLIGAPVAEFAGWNPFAVVASLVAAPVVIKISVYALGYGNSPQVHGIALMAIQKEIWVDYIMDNLFKDQEFLQYAYNADEFVLEGKVVHIPQSGSKPTVVKNRTSLPATNVQRTDTDVTYNLDEFTTDPTLIQDTEAVEASYSKMDSVLGEHKSALYETIGDYMLYNWRVTSSSHMLRTTGAAVAAHLASATGNRKKFVKEDLKRARTLMNKLNIPKNDRYALFSSDLLDQLMDDADLVKRDNGKELDLPNGVIMRLYGFNIMERSWTLPYDNATPPVPKAVGAAGAAADNDAVICWQKNMVERALGTQKVFENADDANNYGTVVSALLRAGGRKRRSGGEGVVAIIQDASA